MFILIYIKGYTDNNCLTKLNPCHSNPCKNGYCVDTLSAEFICTCFSNFTGVLCDKEVSVCDKKPCLNKATCIEEKSKKLGYTCSCAPSKNIFLNFI